MTQFPLKDEEFYVETRDSSPSNLLVKIESFSLLSKHGISKYECREFEAGGYNWKVTVCPNGDEHVGVWLSVSESSSELPVDWEVDAIFSFYLFNHISNNYYCFRGTTRRFNALLPKWGFSKVIPYKSLIDPRNGYVVDDTCVFGAEVFVIKSQRINECLSLLQQTPPFKRKWKISHFSKLVKNWHSEEFSVGGQKWKVKVLPKGISSVKKQYVSVYVHIVDSDNKFGRHYKVKADVTLRIKSKTHDAHQSKNYNHWFTSCSRSQGFREFIRIADMSSKGFLVNDCCILEIEISVQALALDAPTKCKS